MNDLTIIKWNGGAYLDSREVADVIGKRHDHLLRDIGKYREIMAKSIAPNFGVNDFFLESAYTDSIGRTLPRYLLSKMGCEMVANKLTGEKGVLFTAAYVSKFNEMEANERSEQKERTLIKLPSLGECNAAARIIVRAMQNNGEKSDCIVRFLKGLYEPLGIPVVVDIEYPDIPETYTAKQIAKIFGIYSLTGKLHFQAVACILNEIILIDEKRKTVITKDYGSHIGVSVRYDEMAVENVRNWLIDNDWPKEIYGFERTYHVLYDLESM